MSSPRNVFILGSVVLTHLRLAQRESKAVQLGTRITSKTCQSALVPNNWYGSDEGRNDPEKEAFQLEGPKGGGPEQRATILR